MKPVVICINNVIYQISRYPLIAYKRPKMHFSSLAGKHRPVDLFVEKNQSIVFLDFSRN